MSTATKDKPANTSIQDKLSAPSAPDPDAPREYAMPAITTGEQVLWYPDAAEKAGAQPAVVLAVGQRAIAVFTWALNSAVGHESVHHISDPLLQENVSRRSSGGWDYTNLAKRVMKLETALKDLGN